MPFIFALPLPRTPSSPTRRPGSAHYKVGGTILDAFTHPFYLDDSQKISPSPRLCGENPNARQRIPIEGWSLSPPKGSSYLHSLSQEQFVAVNGDGILLTAEPQRRRVFWESSR